MMHVIVVGSEVLCGPTVLLSHWSRRKNKNTNKNKFTKHKIIKKDTEKRTKRIVSNNQASIDTIKRKKHQQMTKRMNNNNYNDSIQYKNMKNNN